MKKITLILLLLTASRLMAGTAPTTFTFNPQCFVANKGQVQDQHGNANNDVSFIYARGLFNLQLKRDGFSYELFESINEMTGLPESGIHSADEQNDKPIDLNDDHTTLRSHRIDVKILGANGSCELVGADKGAVFNFYTPGVSENGLTAVPSYGQIIYRNIYPQIDLVFSAGNEDEDLPLKYEWILHPGADPAVIQMEYSGTQALFPMDNGGFRMMASTGSISESAVTSFYSDDKSTISSSYNFNGNRIGYHVAGDRNRTIIIDPNIIWAGYYGGNLDEDVSNGDLTVDDQGKTIIVGNTASTLYMASSGAFQTTYGGGIRDGFIAKFTSNGKLNWATFYGGNEKDECHSVVTDGSKNVFVGGLTVSASGIATPGSYQNNFGGWQDGFVVKFNSSGVRQWATYFGGTVQDEILNAVCDSYGNLYFCGYTTSPDHIATPGAYQTVLNNVGGNNGDAFLAEFTTSGKLVWSTYFSGPQQDRAHAVTLGNNADLFIEGTVESATQIATPGAYQTAYGGGTSDAFVAKWDTNGNLSWCSYFGGNWDDHGRGVKTDAAGNPYIIGWTYSDVGIGTTGALQPHWYEAYENNGDRKSDGFIAKFNLNGSLAWGTYYGGDGKDQTLSLVIDKAKEVLYAGGFTTSHQNISTPNTFQPTYSGTQDGYLVKLNQQGQRLWGTYMGADDVESLYTLDLASNNYLHILMETDGGSFSVSPDAYQTKPHGASETIVIKYSVSDSCVDTYEPNNNPTESKLIKAFSDTTLYGYTGAISSSADADWFRVKVNPTNFKIVLTDLPADYDLKLYKQNGQLIKSSTNSGTTDETIIFNNILKGTYAIEIAHANSVFNAFSCYRLKTMTSNTPWLMKEGIVDASVPEKNLEMHLYPNPCSDVFTMKLTAVTNGKVDVTIYNLLHQPVQNSALEVEAGTQTLSFPVSQLAPGLYLVEVISASEKIASMIAVE